LIAGRQGELNIRKSVGGQTHKTQVLQG